MKDNFTTLQADGDFSFSFLIEKAIPVDGEDMVIQGIASTTNIDHDKERMSEHSLKSMANIINTDSVPLRLEHQKEDAAIIGKVFSATLDERNQLWIKARLDKSHPAASLLYKSLKEGVKLGLSVGGRVKRAIKELSESTGQMVKTFYDVTLDEVSVTQRPANYDSWLVRKSIVKDGEDTSAFYKSSLYFEFLDQNPKLDYIRAFAKSVPDKSWIKINNINKNMEDEKKKEDMKDEAKKGIEDIKDAKKEDEKKEKSEDDKEEEKEKAVDEKEEGKEEDKDKSYVTTKSFNESMSMIAKGFNSLTDALSKMTKGEAVKVDPIKTEEDTEVETEATKAMDDEKDEEKEKAREGQEDSKGDGSDEHGEREEKAADKPIDFYEGKEGKKEKSQFENALQKIESLQRAVEEINSVNKSVKTGNVASIDLFVAGISNYVEAFKEKFAKSNTSVVGFESYVVNQIRNDSEMQKCIREMLAEPGFKKSVSMGVPVMRTKEGRSFQLSATPITGDKVEKSEKKTDFKSAWKTEFASK